MLRPARGILIPLAFLLAACDDGPSDPSGDAPEPLVPVPAPVLAQASGTLEAQEIGRDIDTVRITLPAGRVLGVTIEAAEPTVFVGAGAVLAVPGGLAFSALLPGTGSLEPVLYTADELDFDVDYTVRAVAVNEAPEHADAELTVGGAFAREMTDPPLDIDVFALELEQGDAFVVEMDTEGGQVTARIFPPGSTAALWPFAATGPELAQSEVFVAQADGAHRIEVYSVGLTADVERTYRIRVLAAE